MFSSFCFRRTPRRKLVFSSSDDETDNSPQSISSGKNIWKEEDKWYFFVSNILYTWIWIVFFFFFVSSSCPPARTSRWTVSVPYSYIFFFFFHVFWCRSIEVDCMNIKQSTLWFATESFYLIYDWQFDGTRVYERAKERGVRSTVDICLRFLSFSLSRSDKIEFLFRLI